MLAVTGFTLAVVTLLGAMSIVFVYVVEDEFFEAILLTESERQQAHHRAHGSYTEPALAFVKVYSPGDALPADLDSQHPRKQQRREYEGAHGRHYHLHQLDAHGTLLVAEVSGQLIVRALRPELLQWLVAASGVLTLLALLLGWRLSRRIGEPLEKLALRVAASRPDALPENLAHGLEHDEVGELARHLDELHRRTRAFIAREQEFTADVSHELRTPLAVLALACERMDRPVMQAAIWQLQQTVELMLALARETTPNGPGAAEHRLLPMLEQLLLSYAPLLDREGVHMELDVPADLTRPWSPALTKLMVGNLLANAIAHRQTPRVRIEASATELSVCNESPPLPQAVLDAGGRGVKGEDSTGFGLGLSILRRVAQTHALALHLSHRDGQTRATLRAEDAFASASRHGF